MEDFFLEHRSHIIGIVEILLFTAILIRHYQAKLSAALALIAAPIAIGLALMIEYMTLPLTAVMPSRPRNPIDLLLLNKVTISGALITLGYAFLLFALFLLIRKSLRRQSAEISTGVED